MVPITSFYSFDRSEIPAVREAQDLPALLQLRIGAASRNRSFSAGLGLVVAPPPCPLTLDPSGAYFHHLIDQ